MMAAPVLAILLAAPAPPSTELRTVLREYFVHLLVEDLGLPSDEATTVAPLVKDLLDAQREASRARQALAGELWEASLGGDVARSREALRRHDELERESARSLAARRSAVLAELAPRQQVRFLAFEDRFRRRVREMIGTRRRQGERPGEQDVPAPRGPSAVAPDGGGGDPGGDSPLGDEVQETLEVLFVHELRTRLALPQETTLAILPHVDALFAAQASLRKEHGAILRELRHASEDAAASEQSLTALVTRARAQEEGTLRVAEARRAIVAELDPVKAAGFVAFEHRFWQEARRRARALALAGQAGEPGRRFEGMRPRRAP